MRQIVTAGGAYLDIDAYAGIIAYAELLQAQGHDALAVSAAPPNASVSNTVLSWGATIHRSYEPRADDVYVLIDISEPDFFAKTVELDRVVAVIDHHVGFEQYWADRIGDDAHIEFIGAACTLVFERWQAAGMIERLSITSARLLMCGILDNTLNFGAKITTERDHHAYKVLSRIAQLQPDWPQQYFMECQAAIATDIINAINTDAKTLRYESFRKPIRAGQLAVWDARAFVAEHEDDIQQTLSAAEPEWFMNLISVGEARSYFLATSPTTQEYLSKLLGITFEGSIGVADRLWLRKEIIKQEAEFRSSTII